MMNLSYLHTKFHRTFASSSQRLPGVSSPFLHFGTELVSFQFHIEDGAAGSFSLLTHGANKTWFVFSAKSYLQVKELMQESLPEAFAKFPSYDAHKTMLLDPRVLKEKKITYTRITQSVGELIYVGMKCFHQVFNWGSNCAIDVNVCSVEKWIPITLHVDSDYCKAETIDFKLQPFILDHLRHNPLAEYWMILADRLDERRKEMRESSGGLVDIEKEMRKKELKRRKEEKKLIHQVVEDDEAEIESDA